MQKRIKLLSVFLLNFCFISCFAIDSKVDIDLTVVDDAGVLVEGANVEIRYPYYDAQKGSRKYKFITDFNGSVKDSNTVETPAKITVIVTKEGYYRTIEYIDVVFNSEASALASEINAVERIKKVVLKPIKNPISMHAKYLDRIMIPESNKVFGFNLKKQDWLEEHSIVSHKDLLLSVNGYWNHSRDQDGYIEIKFSNPGEGIIKYEYDSTSEFKSIYEAPLDGYQSSIKLRKTRIIKNNNQDRTIYSDFKEHPNPFYYVFRTRCKYDDEGNLIEAYYGKIYGSFEFGGAGPDGSYIKIGTIFFNPNNLDRNLEFDTSRNLTDVDRKSRRFILP
tara:strand:+ start:303 stop:1304 length:1002 start_codon:yes stop_codon:yes gene_type:complete